MSHVQSPLLFSIESECLTVAGSAPALTRFLVVLAGLAPSLPGPSGLFNSYGRVYLDGSHLEFAAAECDSPYLLVRMVEQQQRLARAVVTRLRDEGLVLVLANNNHSGLLTPTAASWGCHENYLVEEPPDGLADRMLPFLVSRVVYAGAGGVLHPTAAFVASPRAVFLSTDVGGDTSHDRAIHSTARDEPHLAPGDRRRRYHLILGDGLRSHFGLTLQVGCTALAVQAVQHDPDLLRPVPGLAGPRRRALWLGTLRLFNILASPGAPPRAHPLALRIQQLYLDGARRWYEVRGRGVAWAPRLLEEWRTVLDRLAGDDRPWLVARLDPWIKYELYTAWLAEQGSSWADLPRRPDLLAGLALLDQHYHEFASAESPFERLEQAGRLQHRVGERLPPGAEAEAFVPATATRARARARFLVAHAGTRGLVMNWAEVTDRERKRRRRLGDPFAREYGPWEPVVGAG